MRHDESYVNRISRRLSISHAPYVRDLPDDHEYDLILTLGYYDGMGYERPEASDTDDEFVFPDGPHEYVVFEAAVKRVLEALDDDLDVLVHCQAGVSRSAAVCIAVVATREGVAYEDAYWTVKRVRKNIDPTPELETSARRYIDENA